MSVVISSPVTAMHHGNAVQSYRTPALVGGAVLAAYSVIWWNDYWKSGNAHVWELEGKLGDKSKIYNWRLDEYAVNKPIKLSPKKSVYEHAAFTNGNRNVYNFTKLFADLQQDYRIKLGLADASPETFYKRIHEEKRIRTRYRQFS